MQLKEWHTPTLQNQGAAVLRTLGGTNTASTESLGQATKRTAQLGSEPSTSASSTGSE